MLGWAEPVSYSLFASAALKSAVVLAAGWLSTRLLYRQSAALRHSAWTAAFAALLALPFLSVSLPALRLPFQQALQAASASFRTSASGNAALHLQQRSEISTAPTPKPAPRPQDWPLLMVLLWAAGSAASMAQMLTSYAAIRRIRRSARPLEIRDFDFFVERLGIGRQPDLWETEPGTMPMTFGLFQPAIFMPGDAAKWTEERCRVVLLHELAHVSRGDTATHLLARAALSVYWWNPLAWMAWREFLSERERAADDLVLSCGARAEEYATHLLDIARSMQSAPAMGWAAVAMARPHQLEERLKAILDGRCDRKGAGRVSAMTAAVLAVIIVAPLAAMRAQDSTALVLPIDLDSAIHAAVAQKNPEVLDDAAELAEAMGKFEVAQKLLDSSLTICGQISGQQSSQYGVGLLKLGDLAREQGRFSQARASYTNALALLGSGRDAATVLIHLGTVAVAIKNFDQAMDDFGRAQSLDATRASEAEEWMGIVQERQNNLDKADSFYQGALAAQDPNSALAATIRELYAQFLQQQGRSDQANLMRDQASAVRKELGAEVISQNSGSNVYRIGGAVTAPKLVFKIEPMYSEEARIAKYQGSVTLRVEIGPDGLAHNIQVIRGLGLGLNERARAAITQWRFNPGTKDGQPVTVLANIEVNFRLL